MGPIDDVVRAYGLRAQTQMDRGVQVVPVVIASVSPLTVYVQGGGNAQPARWVAGQKGSIGDSGFAIWWPGQVLPLVFVSETSTPIRAQVTGPAANTDATNIDVTLVSSTLTLKAGRQYRVTGYLQSTQITATGTPFCRVVMPDGVAYRFPTMGNSLSYAANQVAVGSVSAEYVPAASGSGTFSIVVRTSAGGLRTAVGGAILWIDEL